MSIRFWSVIVMTHLKGIYVPLWWEDRVPFYMEIDIYGFMRSGDVFFLN